MYFKNIICRILILTLASTFIPYISFCQSDTSRVIGKVKWKNELIEGFPNKIKVTKKEESSFLVFTEIDSSGNYSVFLPNGDYHITTAKNYYWMNDDYLRIDYEKSFVSVNVLSQNIIKVPVLEIDTLMLPALIPEKGILHNFDNEKSHLLDDFIKTYQKYYEIPGVSLALIKDGQILYHKYLWSYK